MPRFLFAPLQLGGHSSSFLIRDIKVDTEGSKLWKFSFELHAENSWISCFCTDRFYRSYSNPSGEHFTAFLTHESHGTYAVRDTTWHFKASGNLWQRPCVIQVSGRAWNQYTRIWNLASPTHLKHTTPLEISRCFSSHYDHLYAACLVAVIRKQLGKLLLKRFLGQDTVKHLHLSGSEKKMKIDAGWINEVSWQNRIKPSVGWNVSQLSGDASTGHAELIPVAKRHYLEAKVEEIGVQATPDVLPSKETQRALVPSGDGEGDGSETSHSIERTGLHSNDAPILRVIFLGCGKSHRK